jgi:hypothetical protein
MYSPAAETVLATERKGMNKAKLRKNKMKYTKDMRQNEKRDSIIVQVM